MKASEAVLAMHPDDRGWFVEAYLAASRERVAFSARLRLRDRGRTYRWVLFHGTPTFREDGEFAGYVGCVTNASRH